MSTGLAALAWIGLAVGAAVLGVALALLYRTLRPLREIKRYVDDTLAAAGGIAANLEGAGELLRTRELVAALPELARARLGTPGEAR